MWILSPSVSSPLDDVVIVEVDLDVDPLQQHLPPMLRQERGEGFSEEAADGAQPPAEDSAFISQRDYALCQPLNPGPFKNAANASIYAF